jgi:hypothetical protein
LKEVDKEGYATVYGMGFYFLSHSNTQIRMKEGNGACDGHCHGNGRTLSRYMVGLDAIINII